jgi:hypothetical protein
MDLSVLQVIAHFILLAMEKRVNYNNAQLREMFGIYARAQEQYIIGNIREYSRLIDEIIEYGQKRRLYAATCNYTKIGSIYRIEISFIEGLVVEVEELKLNVE